MRFKHVLNDMIAFVRPTGAHIQVGHFKAIVQIVGMCCAKGAHGLVSLFVFSERNEEFHTLPHSRLITFSHFFVAIESVKCGFGVVGVVINGDQRSEIFGLFVARCDHFEQTRGAHPLSAGDPMRSQRAEIKFVGGFELRGTD